MRFDGLKSWCRCVAGHIQTPCTNPTNPPQRPKNPIYKNRRIPPPQTRPRSPNSKRGQPKNHTPTKILLEYSNNPEHEHVNVREASRKRVNQTAKILILNLSEENVKGNRQEISHDQHKGTWGVLRRVGAWNGYSGKRRETKV